MFLARRGLEIFLEAPCLQKYLKIWISQHNDDTSFLNCKKQIACSTATWINGDVKRFSTNLKDLYTYLYYKKPASFDKITVNQLRKDFLH